MNILLSVEVPRCGDLFFAPAFGFCQLNIEFLFLIFAAE
jgi:hypothetical protein